MTLAQWLDDFRWVMNVMRARRWRREILFSQRLRFDDALRPILKDGARIAYPDALYHITVKDLGRAVIESVKGGPND